MVESMTFAMIFIPVVIMIGLTIAFGHYDNSLVLHDISLIQNFTRDITDRQACIDSHPECSSDNCQLVDPDGSFGSGHGFPCGDTYYVLFAIAGSIISPLLVIALPVLLMFPITTISVLGATYVLTDYWFFYAPMWASFGLGILTVVKPF